MKFEIEMSKKVVVVINHTTNTKQVKTLLYHVNKLTCL